jgi:CRISPR-associated protein Cmr3
MNAAANGDWRSFQLVPDDLLFFRDGKPSSLGNDHYLRSVFPPYPSTLYGAIRSRRLVDESIELHRLSRDAWAELPESLRQELGPWGGFGSLEMRGPWLVCNGEPLLPAPLDLAIRRAPASDDAPPRATEVFRLSPWTNAPGEASHALAPLRPLPEPTGSETDPEPPRDWWIRPAGLTAWQAGAHPASHDLVHRSELWIDEPRTGVGLQADQRSGKDGLIYTFGFVRLLPGVTLGFEVHGADLKPHRRILLGGEGRTGWIEEGPLLPQAPAPIAGAKLRIALVTPALWETGALPVGDDGDDDSTGPKYRGATIEAAAVPGSLPVGGWDLAKARPKPMRRAVPAGSVLFLDAGSPQAATDVAVQLHGSNLSTYPDEHLAQQGFGLAVAGYAPQEANDG